MPAYNLFRHRAKQELVCAVPEDCAVPAFIAEEAWEFDRKLTETAAAPMGFDASAAAASVRFNPPLSKRGRGRSTGASSRGPTSSASGADLVGWTTLSAARNRSRSAGQSSS
jgi:hypothetical protein